MNIRNFLIRQLVLLPACLAWTAAHAVLAQELDVAQASSPQLRSAYLECDRVSAASRVEPNFMIACERVGTALRDSDFAGDLERLLQWWRRARAAPPATTEPEAVPTGTGAPTPAAPSRP